MVLAQLMWRPGPLFLNWGCGVPLYSFFVDSYMFKLLHSHSRLSRQEHFLKYRCFK